MKQIKWFLPVMLFALCMIGCSGKQVQMRDIPVKISGGDAPEWVGSPGSASDENTLAFVGVSRNMIMEADAREDARISAMSQAITDMGSKGERLIMDANLTESGGSSPAAVGMARKIGTRIQSETSFVGSAREFHIEWWKDSEKNGGREYYKAYCLYLIPKDAVKQYMENILARLEADRLSAEEKANIERARSLLDEMGSGYFEQAR